MKELYKFYFLLSHVKVLFKFFVYYLLSHVLHCSVVALRSSKYFNIINGQRYEESFSKMVVGNNSIFFQMYKNKHVVLL